LRLLISGRLAQEIAIALFDPVSITRKIEATPYAHAPNVVIAYPHFEDWKKLYRPLPMPDARGIYRNVDAFVALSGHEARPREQRAKATSRDSGVGGGVGGVCGAEGAAGLFGVYDYAYHPIDQASILEQPMARALLTDLRHAQPSLFVTLARVDAAFNPIRQIEDQRRKLQGG
jgi:hypothetical protein